MNILNLQITNLEQLHKAYMPFIKNGGIFIATETSYLLHEKIKVRISLFQEDVMMEGNIVWITPTEAQSEKRAGVGIQFTTDAAQVLVKKIESYLADFDSTNSTTDTL